MTFKGVTSSWGKHMFLWLNCLNCWEGSCGNLDPFGGLIFQHFYFLPGFFTNGAWFSEASSLRVAKEKEVKSLGFSLLSPRCMNWWIGWVGWVDGLCFKLRDPLNLKDWFSSTEITEIHHWIFRSWIPEYPRSAGIFRGERPLCTIMEIACQAVKDNVYEGAEGRRGKEEAVANAFFV